MINLGDLKCSRSILSEQLEGSASNVSLSTSVTPEESDQHGAVQNLAFGADLLLLQKIRHDCGEKSVLTAVTYATCFSETKCLKSFKNSVC